MSALAQAAEPQALVVAARDQLATAYVRQQPTDTVTSMLGRDELLVLSYGAFEKTHAQASVTLPNGTSVPVLVATSDQFAARLRKNARLRAKWAKREDITCYRIYDADLPDYAVSIELYRGTDPATGEPTNRSWLQIFEYAAPKDIDPLVARSRLMDVLSLAPQILDVNPHDTFVRVRRRDKGGSQYAAEASEVRARPVSKGHVPLPPGAHLIDEGGLVFEVNFSTRLDCGIFLDHRDTRAMLREMAKQTKGSKRFLNLFAYTGTATCYAADGGMRYTTTVDLSKPSLDWARRNMARNGFVGKEHEFVQADVVRWVSEQRRTKNRWDLVFCDVPTFSNSNRMGKRSFDVQRDHAELLIGVSRLLVRGGVCVFSCNLRSFAPDVEALQKAGVSIEDITDKTIPEDFSRNKRIHHAYLVRRVSQ
jgi:23S rRNA (guanine2445-N2)-methyltransferase / 23S rRNA (guanine2069-N7)-methyltransferase